MKLDEFVKTAIDGVRKGVDESAVKDAVVLDLKFSLGVDKDAEPVHESNAEQVATIEFTVRVPKSSRDWSGP